MENLLTVLDYLAINLVNGVFVAVWALTLVQADRLTVAD
jgi:hypothetical protein